MKIPELLAPAGNLEKLKIAIDYGADAVYCAGKSFGLRAKADNFTKEELELAINYAHQRSKKVYLTLNIIAHNSDLDRLKDYLEYIDSIDIDALIVSDPGILYLIGEAGIDIPIHLSTQANTVNWASAKFWEEYGLERLILARELSVAEIKEIRDKTDIELETFVHGAMCISYSGRCLLSNYMTGRDANRGNCAQPCRWEYNLVENKRPGQLWEIDDDGDRGSYIMNSKDLNLFDYLPSIINAGVDSLKIEGRMKSLNYVATVTSVYRKALDNILDEGEKYQTDPELANHLNKISHRPYTTGFYEGQPGPAGQNYTSSSYIRNYKYLGIVKGYLPELGQAIVQVKNKINIGDIVEFFGPGADSFKQKITDIYSNEGEELEVANHPESIVKLPVSKEISENYIIRRRENEEN
ncbi:MAG: peptidase U32 family protein [Bacillota bacterium]